MAVYIDKELCKSCKLCKNNCPKDVFEITHKVNKKRLQLHGGSQTGGMYQVQKM